MRTHHRHHYQRPASVPARLRVCTVCNKTEHAIIRERAQEKVSVIASLKLSNVHKEIDPWDRAMQMTKDLANKRIGHNFAFVYRDKHGQIKAGATGQGVCYGNYPYIHPAARISTNKPLYFVDAAVGRFYTADQELYGSSYNPPGRDGQSKTNWGTLEDFEKEYVRWALNDSPFAKAFLIKDPEYVVNYGSIMDVTLPPSFVLSAGVMFRWLTEKPKHKRVVFWHMFKDKVGPEMALLMSQICQYTIDNVEKSTLSLLASEQGFWCYGHGIFMPSMTVNGLIRYFTHDLSALEGLETMETQYSYAGRHRAWTIDQGRDGGKIKFPKMKTRTKKTDLGGAYTEHYWPNNSVESWAHEFIKLNNLKGKLCLGKRKSAS